jgi:hypothetical protein
MHFDSAVLLHSTPIGRGIDLTDCYVYGHEIIHGIDSDDGN